MKMLMPRWPAALIGAGEHEADVGDRRVVDPDLAAVEPPALAVPRRGGADAGHVGAGLGLGDAIGGEFLGPHQRSQPRRAAGRRAVPHQQRRDEFDEAALVGDRSVAARQFLHHDRIGECIEAGAAEVFRHRDAEQTEPAHLPVDLSGKPLFAVKLLGHGRIASSANCRAMSRTCIVHVRKIHRALPYVTS